MNIESDQDLTDFPLGGSDLARGQKTLSTEPATRLEEPMIGQTNLAGSFTLSESASVMNRSTLRLPTSNSQDAESKEDRHFGDFGRIIHRERNSHPLRKPGVDGHFEVVSLGSESCATCRHGQDSSADKQ